MDKNFNFTKFTWEADTLLEALETIVEAVVGLTSFGMPLCYEIKIENSVLISTYSNCYHSEISYEEIKKKYDFRVGKISSDFVRSIPSINMSEKKEQLKEFDGLNVNTSLSTNGINVFKEETSQKIIKIIEDFKIGNEFVIYIDCNNNIKILWNQIF